MVVETNEFSRCLRLGDLEILKKLSFILPMAVAMICATNLPAQHDDRHHNDDRHHIYDRHHRDYHDFDEHEDRAYHLYWREHHHAYIDWERANARQRQAYWDWRHRHSDAILHIDIR
jgi:hypothetical protein